MKSRWVINILLLLAIGILSLVARYEPGIEEQVEAQTITALGQDQVRRIHINRPVRDDLVLKKDSAQNWSIERAPVLAADKLQVNALVRLAEQKAVRSYAASDLDLSKLQLAPPYATVVLNDTPIEFGGLEPLEGLRYIRIAEQVHLIPDLYQHLIEADYTQFIRRRLFEEGARISHIALPEFSLTLEAHSWSIQPEQEVSADKLQRFVDLWQDATALHIQSGGSDQPGDPVEVIYNKPPQQVNFVITAREPELVLLRSDLGIQYRMGSRSDSLLGLESAESEAQE